MMAKASEARRKYDDALNHSLPRYDTLSLMFQELGLPALRTSEVTTDKIPFHHNRPIHPSEYHEVL